MVASLFFCCRLLAVSSRSVMTCCKALHTCSRAFATLDMHGLMCSSLKNASARPWTN